MLFVVHHLTLVITWSSFAVGRWGHLFAVPTMLTEMTAPFILARWVLAEVGRTAGPFYLLNGLAIIVSWCVGMCVCVGGGVGILPIQLCLFLLVLSSP